MTDVSGALQGRRFAGRVCVVTGGGSGIGATTVRRFAAEGARVIIVDVEAGPADALVAELRHDGATVEAVLADVADEQAWQDIAARAAAHGGAAVLVANAFTTVVEPAATMSLPDWERQLRVNLTGAFLGFRALSTQLADAGGSVVLVSSVHAVIGLPGHPAYAASKGGLTALARQLAVDAGPQVRVNSVLPGPIDTRTWDGVDEAGRAISAGETVLARMGRPAEVAAAIAFLASPDASYISGASLPVDGGWSITKRY